MSYDILLWGKAADIKTIFVLQLLLGLYTIWARGFLLEITLKKLMFWLSLNYSF